MFWVALELAPFWQQPRKTRNKIIWKQFMTCITLWSEGSCFHMLYLNRSADVQDLVHVESGPHTVGCSNYAVLMTLSFDPPYFA